MKQTIKTHTKFVQDIQYAPSGDHFVSVGTDAKIFVYDGKTGETVAELTENAHSGSIVRADSMFIELVITCMPSRWLSAGIRIASLPSRPPLIVPSSSVRHTRPLESKSTIMHISW